MTTLLGGAGMTVHTTRRVPQAGEVGCPGSCPLCAVPGRAAPPCLACRDELRARLAEFNLHRFVEAALN